VKALAWIALTLSVVSIAVSVWVVAISPRALQQLRVLDFPLTGIGEAAIAMFLPILLSTLACLVAVFTVRRPLGRVALGLGAISWLVLWSVLGVEGFHHLF
jgi:hypothetical protein